MTSSASVRSREDEGTSRPAGIPHRRLILATIALVVIGAAVTWVVGFTSVLGVNTVQVRGEYRLTADQVRTAANITHGTPLVRLDTDAVRRRVAGMPDVASVQVTRSFPSTVVITVVERVAIGVVQVYDGYLLVDRTGDQFRTVQTRPPRLPLFVVPHGPDAQATAGAVATVAAALPGSLLGRITSIQALDPNAITLLLTYGRVVFWGSTDRSADKARVLPALLHQPGTQFDVTEPDQPFTR